MDESALLELTKDLPPEGLDAFRRELLVASAQADDSPESFAAFYELVQGNPLSEKHRREIDYIYRAHEDESKAALIWSWRGSWKTVTLTITFTAYRIGIEPHRANLIIMANDASAVDSAAAIASIVEHNRGFADVFPNVKPDPERGWGDAGYEVKDTSIGYSAWREKNSSRRDPTLLGLGINSKSLIGKHPDGCLWLDDIHDEENSKSELQRRTIVGRLKSTIFEFLVEDKAGKMVTWMIAVGTPWEEDDAYHYLRETGECVFYKHPVMEKLADEEVEGGVYYDGSEFPDLMGSWSLSWDERWNFDVILRWRRRTGKREFARMYLLDLDASRETGFKYMLFPAERIDITWRVNQGIDFGSVTERAKVKNVKERSYFAQLWGAKVPTGGMVVMGGKFGHFTAAQSESSIEQIQNTFHNYGTAVIESDGKGELFVDIISRKPHLRITPMLTRGVAKSKRQERLETPLELGIIRISDADSPALNLLRQALDNYPGGNQDIRDALYWLARSMPEVFVVPSANEDLPQDYGETREKGHNPIYALAKM